VAAVWSSGNMLVSNNMVVLQWARLVLGWVVQTFMLPRTTEFLYLDCGQLRQAPGLLLSGTAFWNRFSSAKRFVAV